MTNCWLKIRNFSRLSFFLPPPIGHARNLAARLDRVNQEALLGIAVAHFPFGAGFGHLLVHFAARIGVLQNEFRHLVAPSGVHQRGAGRHLEPEHGIVDGWIQLLAVQLEGEERQVLHVITSRRI